MSSPHTKQVKPPGKTSRPDRHATGPIKANGGGTSEQQDPQTDPALKLQSRIARRSERIARWNKEYNEVEASWPGGLEYRRFCQRMADSAHEKQQELVAELEQLQTRSAHTWNAERQQPIQAQRPTAQIPTMKGSATETPLPKQATAIAFDLDPASLSTLRKALPGWNIEILAGATAASLTNQWHPGKVDLLVVKADDETTRTLALCRFLVRRPVVSRDSQKHATDTLGPRGSLQTQAQRAHAPLLVLVPGGQEDLVNSMLEAGAHSCLMLPIEAKDVASMLVHARAGNLPGRHTDNLEQAQSQDRWRDDGGQG